MTIAKSFTSIPRAATSVATSTLTFPALKSFNTAKRFFCGKSPMMNSLFMPLISSRFDSTSHIFFVLQKIITLAGFSLFSKPMSNRFFSSLETWSSSWSMSSTVIFSASIVISFASRVYSHAKFLTYELSVAEKSIVCRFSDCGKTLRSVRKSG